MCGRYSKSPTSDKCDPQSAARRPLETDVSADVRASLDSVWRLEAPRVTARLTRIVGDLDTAEELAQDTFVAALQRWEQDGIPRQPAAWLTTTARFLAVD